MSSMFDFHAVAITLALRSSIILHFKHLKNVAIAKIMTNKMSMHYLTSSQVPGNETQDNEILNTAERNKISKIRISSIEKDFLASILRSIQQLKYSLCKITAVRR